MRVVADVLRALSQTRRPLLILRDLQRDARGVALIEFAYTLPIFIGFGFVGLECTNVVLAHQKSERIASTLADQVAGNMVPPNESQMEDLFKAVDLIAEPFELRSEGNAIITAVLGVYDVMDDTVQNKVAWQRCSTKGSFKSVIGKQWEATIDIADGPEVELPNQIDLLQNEMVIVTEVFLPYTPLISEEIVANLLPEDGIVRQTSVFRTRGNVLFSVTPVPGVESLTC